MKKNLITLQQELTEEEFRRRYPGLVLDQHQRPEDIQTKAKVFRTQRHGIEFTNPRQQEEEVMQRFETNAPPRVLTEPTETRKMISNWYAKHSAPLRNQNANSRATCFAPPPVLLAVEEEVSS